MKGRGKLTVEVESAVGLVDTKNYLESGYRFFQPNLQNHYLNAKHMLKVNSFLHQSTISPPPPPQYGRLTLPPRAHRTPPRLVWTVCRTSSSLSCSAEERWVRWPDRMHSRQHSTPHESQ